MMGFFDNVKKAFDSNKKGNESKNSEKIKNFKYLSNLIHSGLKEITLDSDIIISRREEKKYNQGIFIEADDLIIDGNGHTIDAGGLTRIFRVFGRNITIKNMTLKNGFTHHIGAAIQNEGELTVINVNFLDNKTEGEKSRGGAIFNMNKLNICNSTLSNNSSYIGGAIQNEGELNITNSTLSANTSEISGGAIFNNRGELRIKDSTLSDNKVTLGKFADDGGAIWNNHFVEILNCKITNNYSPETIIYNKDSLLIHNTIFNHNQSKFLLWNIKGNMSIFNGEFIENNIENSIIENQGLSCTLNETIFENNVSYKHITNSSDLTLISPKINDDGKPVLNFGHLLIRKSLPEFENKIENNGEITIEHASIPIKDKFDFGHLDKKIRNSESKIITLNEDICFENYERDFYEGGIELDIDNLVIDGNGKTIDGNGMSRIFHITGNNITLKNIIFKNGCAHKDYNNVLNNDGGSLRINHDVDITIKQCKFINNTSKNHGGAIVNYGMLSIIDSIISDNKVTGFYSVGGAIYNSGVLDIIDSTLSNNATESNSRYSVGGAIFNKGMMVINNSTLSNNTSFEGCAIYNERKLRIRGSDISHNSTELDYSSGGAISNMGELYIKNSTLNNNKTNGNHSKGGAIINKEGKVMITKSTLNNNKANGKGGAISNSGIIIIKDSILNKNLGSSGGGAIYGGELNICESTLSYNEAGGRGGGAIFAKHKKYLKTNNCTFNNNTPDDITYFNKILDI